MNIEITKFQIVQFIKMFRNNFKPTEFFIDVRNIRRKKIHTFNVNEQKILLCKWVIISEKHY